MAVAADARPNLPVQKGIGIGVQLGEALGLDLHVFNGSSNHGFIASVGLRQGSANRLPNQVVEDFWGRVMLPTDTSPLMLYANGGPSLEITASYGLKLFFIRQAPVYLALGGKLHFLFNEQQRLAYLVADVLTFGARVALGWEYWVGLETGHKLSFGLEGSTSLIISPRAWFEFGAHLTFRYYFNA